MTRIHQARAWMPTLIQSRAFSETYEETASERERGEGGSEKGWRESEMRRKKEWEWRRGRERECVKCVCVCVWMCVCVCLNSGGVGAMSMLSYPENILHNRQNSVNDINQTGRPFPCSWVHQTSAQSLNASPLAWCGTIPEAWLRKVRWQSRRDAWWCSGMWDAHEVPGPSNLQKVTQHEHKVMRQCGIDHHPINTILFNYSYQYVPTPYFCSSTHPSGFPFPSKCKYHKKGNSYLLTWTKL